jgi:hypothetical protein
MTTLTETARTTAELGLSDRLWSPDGVAAWWAACKVAT